MHGAILHAKALDLLSGGMTDAEVGAAIGVPRRTVSDWRRGIGWQIRPDTCDACPECGHRRHDFDRLPISAYAYLLAMYLGDGHIVQSRTWRLRITMDMKWPGIISECASAMCEVLPGNVVNVYQPDPNSNCVVASVYSRQLPCLFPQHGSGLKHLRPIVLADWQRKIVSAQPERFVRGLVHSDGSRFINRVQIKGKIYTYPRYNFTNASADIRKLFTDSCDQLGIAWRQMNARNISIARREAVARLDEFVGAKY